MERLRCIVSSCWQGNVLGDETVDLTLKLRSVADMSDAER